MIVRDSQDDHEKSVTLNDATTALKRDSSETLFALNGPNSCTINTAPIAFGFLGIVKQILTIAPHFPSLASSRDGQGNYLTAAVPALARAANCEVRVLALQIGDQPPHESGRGWSVHRTPPPTPIASVFDLYLPKCFRPSLDALLAFVKHETRALSIDVPIWAHGYETGACVQHLTAAGFRVVAVPHYLVGVETIHDLALGDDAIRRAAFDSPIATALGRLTPKRARPMGVRWASRAGAWARHGVWPRAIKTQFSKLDLERRMIAHASAIVAVGPSFEDEMNALYPCTVGRSQSVIGGGPDTLPEPTWPWSRRPRTFRIAMVGRPTGQKGWDYAAESLSALDAATRSRIELVIIGGLGTGSGPYSDYSERVSLRFQEVGIPRFQNLGELSHSETLAHLGGADLLLFPSVFEPLGLVLIEAMRSGCCVLASNAAGPSDVLRRPWGRVVDFRDPDRRVSNLTDALESFLETDVSILADWGQAARAAGTEFTWDSCVSVHLGALRPA